MTGDAPAHPDFDGWLGGAGAVLAKGPIALILIEDDVAVTETLAHHIQAGFRHILALSPDPVTLPQGMEARVTNLRWNTRRQGAHTDAVNLLIRAVPPKTWLYYCYNAEFLFFPFSETRSVGEMLTFHVEERRDAMLTYVVDLYARDLEQADNGVDLQGAMFDKAGYYALGRSGPDGPKDRQLDFHGGLRWRFEELLPPDRRRIDRIALFRAAEGLQLLDDHRFNIEEYNTFSCQWHHNLTAAITSFRVAKALVRNPGSRDRIDSFVWSNSQPFEWKAQQLLDLGLIEPGQWF